MASHQGIKDTTIGTGWKEFRQALSQDPDIPYNGQDVNDVDRRGYIAYIENSEGSVNTETGDSDVTNEIKTWLESNGQYIDLWIHGHYHRKIGESWNGRGRYTEKYGTRFLLCGPTNSKLGLFYLNNLEVKSNDLFIKGNKLRVRTYVHSDPSSTIPEGFYDTEEFEFFVKRTFIK